jgi:ubiquinone/menaquinone biosynthesis C-methylase UbiE
VRNRIQARVWTTKTYDKLSKYYDTFMRILFPVGERGRERVVEKLDSGTVLDVACGTGTLLALASEKGLKCYGLDLSEGMLVQARRKTPAAEIERASYYEMPFPDSCFDYVIATNALSSDFIDAKRVLSEMIRVCKNGGEVYIAEWPKAAVDTFTEKVVVGLAKLNDDAPKDYLEIFRELGYKPDVEVLDKRFHVFGIKK